MKLLLKNTFKKISKSLGRFFSITLIIALGISVFMGLREATAGMLYTADNYYDKNNLMDFKIISSYGLTDSDVEALIQLDYVENVIPTYSVDVLDNGNSIRIHALEEEINNVTLVSGRMPKNNNECIADYYEYKIGDIITFENKNLPDFLSINKCEVVGTITSVLYVRNEKGISSIGNGKLISFIFINRDSFVSEYYTEIYIVEKEAKEMKSYYDDYSTHIELLRDELEQLKPIRETIRYEEILKEANDEIVKIKSELNKQVKIATDQLDKTKKQLDKSKDLLKTTKENTLAEFDNNYDLLEENKNYLISNLTLLNINQNELDITISNLSNNINILKQQLTTITDQDEYNELNNQIIQLESNYTNLLTIKNGLLEIETNKNELDDNLLLFQNEIYTENLKQIIKKIH